MHFTPQELWAATGTPVRIVLATMMIMAIWCIYVAIERTMALNKAKKQSRALAEAVAPTLGKADADGALAICQQDEFAMSYLGHMLVAGLKEFAGRGDKYGIEAAERALDRVSVTETQSLRKGMNMLATTGATAPFVGLVGTIFGIINAFQMMGEAGGGDAVELVGMEGAGVAASGVEGGDGGLQRVRGQVHLGGQLVQARGLDGREDGRHEQR